MRTPGFLLALALIAPASALGRPSSSDDTRAGAFGASALSSRTDRLDVDVLGDGTIWVRGNTYKASFGRASTSYVPFLGSDAPRNFPVDLRVVGLTVCGVEQDYDCGAQPVVDAGGTSISYDRGAFTERYLISPNGIEQTFVFDELAQRGEIVATIGVDTAFERRSDADGFRFENEHGHVRYGRAFALDARGRKDAVDACLVSGSIEIRVPAERVVDALLPLTIDPVISTFSVRDTSIDEFDADTAYDATHAAYLTVFEEVFSANDHDVRAVRHSASGQFVAWQTIDISASNWRTPAVANNNAEDQFLVVAAVGATPGREIQARTVEADTMAKSSVFPVSIVAEPGDKYVPDVGGDPADVGPSYYYVVWETAFAEGDRDIHGRLVDTSGALIGLGTQLVSTYEQLDGNPSISNSNGDLVAPAKYWNVVFEREVSPTNRDIWGRRITAGGSLLGPTPTALSQSALDERNPTCSSVLENQPTESLWLVAYQILTAANGWDVHQRVLDGFDLRSYLQLSVQFPTNGLHQTHPIADTDGKGFVVAYVEQAMLGFGTSDVRISTMFWNTGIGFAEENVSVTPGLETDLRPALCTANSGGGSGGETIIAFDRDVGADRDVLATAYDMPAGGPITTFCFGDGTDAVCPCLNFGGTGRGCANSANASGARLRGEGDSSVGGDTFRLTAEGMPNSTTVLFFQGTVRDNGGNGSVFGDGLRCVTGNVIRLGTKVAVGGVATYPEAGDQGIADRGSVDVAEQRHYQARYRNSASFCTPATFNTTNGVTTYWIP